MSEPTPLNAEEPPIELLRLWLAHARTKEHGIWPISPSDSQPGMTARQFVSVLEMAAAIDSLRTQLAEAQREREALRKALEKDLCGWHGPQPEGMKPYPFDQACGTKAFRVTKPCERARRALLGEQVNG